jgi:Zn-dependent M16 (insulinase) family peptidase
MKKRVLSGIFAAVMVLNLAFTAVLARELTFDLISTQKSESLGGTVYRYKHKKTGAEVIYNDTGSDNRQFVLGFKTPPTDSKGANHVLEHALFCGSEKYPTKNIMHYIQNGTSSLYLNGVTADDCTYYMIQSENETEYYNMIDVYMNGIFHPLFLKDENIFRQQGIRVEYEDGKARYNGVVYNELRIKNLNTEENSVNFLSDKLYRAIYGDTTPVFTAGGELDEIKKLTYEDLLRVYNTFYIPSNSMTYISGNQDIDKTLDTLDSFFSENDAKAPDISFEDTKQIPAEKVQEYNVDESTKTVDIGFMSSGVPASADAKDRYAYEIVFDIIKQKMSDVTGYTNMYISGGNTGGITTLALMISGVPIDIKDDIISAYGKVLDDLAKNGIAEKDIDKFVDNEERYYYQTFDQVLIGLLYQDNPLAYTETVSMREYYKSHKEYFAELLKKYFTENPCSVTIVSGNGSFGSEDSYINVSDEELKQIKLDTEAFQKWNDTEDAPDVVDKIPFLTLDEVRQAPEKAEPQYEEENGISFYYTDKSDDNSVSIFFPLNVSDEDFDYVQLMYSFWQYQADKTGNSFYASILPFGSAKDAEKINPHFNLWMSDENNAECLKRTIASLLSEEIWNADDLKEYIAETPKKIIDSYYDPYYLSGELKDSTLSAEGRFSVFMPQNTIVKGSPHYYHFLKSLSADEAEEILPKLKTIANQVILNVKPVVQYSGNTDDYRQFKTAVVDLFKDAEIQSSCNLHLPIGYYSAATVTKLADANHFMIAASYGQDGYSGKLAVLGKVLSTKYITPIMRGKHGAYGSNINFWKSGMTSAVTGLADIDFALGIWEGMGDYLRNLNMTQKELDAFIVSAVQEFDEWEYRESENGADMALSEKSPDECEKIRDEMLSTTVDDLKEYAETIDSFVAQKRVFAVLGKNAADSADFDFAYYGNADTLDIVPRFTRHPKGYINGRSDTIFAPDDNITRAEAAAIISQLTADTRVIKPDGRFSDVPQNAWYAEAVASLCEKGIMSGYDGDIFKPEQNITRAELSSMLSKFIFDGDTKLHESYSDVNGDAWYAPTLAALINSGYMQGYDDGTLRPDSYVTRAEMITVINRMINIKADADSENPFSDLSSWHWAYGDILSALKR